jgi:aromatic ring-opening dioxygenase LigB subunit
VGGIVFAAIAPHGPIAVAEACTDDELEQAAATRAGFEELSSRFESASPETVIVATPHSIHVQGSMAVVLAAELEGAVAGSDGRTIMLECRTDRELADLALSCLQEAGIPAVGASFGGNRLEEAVMPMDWGTLIPLWYLGARDEQACEAVVVSPARDLSPQTHVDAGRALAEAAERSGKRVAFVASADHGHAHAEEGPYGYDPAAKEFDQSVTGLVSANRLDDLLGLDPALVERAAADSWWQLLMLHGALGDRFSAELLSYEAPSYYGMLCAAFTPAG